MSNVYITEPNTTSKLVLHTSYGPLEIELWSKECPITTHNFITLTLERSFENTCFHRIVPNFIVQGGRLESGGSKLLHERGLPKEFHSRLRFSRRGLLGAVSMDTKTSHPSEFFLTLGAAPELNNECTCFGRVVGDTIFNLLRIGEIMTTEDEEGERCKPIWECKLERVEVLMNAFKDIVPRYFPQRTVEAQKQSVDLIKESRDKKLVSFSIQEEELQDGSPVIKPRAPISKVDAKQANPVHAKRQSTSGDNLDKVEKAKEDKIATLKANIARLTAELTGQPSIEEHAEEEGEKKVEEGTFPASALERMRQRYEKRSGVIVGKRQADVEAKETVLKLTAFRNKLTQQRQQQMESDVKVEESRQKEEEEEGGMQGKRMVDLCKLHGLLNCASCRSTFGLNNGLDDATTAVDGDEWMLHRLVFDRTEMDCVIRQDLGNLKVIDPKAEIERVKRKARQH